MPKGIARPASRLMPSCLPSSTSTPEVPIIVMNAMVSGTPEKVEVRFNKER